MTLTRWLLEAQYLLEFLLVWPFATLVRRLSERQSRALARGLSRVAYRVLSRDRRWCLRNLELVFGDQLTPSQRSRLALQSFEHIALTRVESLRWTEEWMVANVIEEGGDRTRALLRKAKADGQALIFLTAHLGNYELIPAWGHHTGWSSAVVYRPQNNWRVERLLAGSRAAYLPRTVPRTPLTTLSLMYALREQQCVGLLIDMNTLGNPVFADFLGIPAASPPGAAALALATGAPVILAIALREPDGRHRLIFHPPFPLLRTGNRQRDLEANTQQYLRALEPYILAHPEQYNWPHPRWRYRPDGTFWTLETSLATMVAERRSSPAVQRRGAPARGVAA